MECLILMQLWPAGGRKSWSTGEHERAKIKSIPPESSRRIKLQERRPCARRIAVYLKRWAPSVKLDRPDVAWRLSP